jgi:hypothetical protein
VLVEHPLQPEKVPVHIDHLRALLDGYESIRPLSNEEAAALAPMTALCHAEFALSEADYFLGVLHSEEKARMAYDGWLVGHARWFQSAAGVRLLQELRYWAVDAKCRWEPKHHDDGLQTILSRTGWRLAGFLTTWIGIWLTTRRLLICWPVVLAADVFYLIVFYRANLRSDALLQVFFIAFTLYGWWNWWRGVREEGEVRVDPLSVRGWLGGLAAGAVGSVLLGGMMVHHGAALPHLDAALTSL